MIAYLTLAFGAVLGAYIAMALEGPVRVVSRKVSEGPNMISDIWIERARQVAVEIAMKEGEVTVDHIWEVCPAPAGVNGRLLGTIFDGSWEKIDEVHSKRGRNAGRKIGVWRLKPSAVEGEPVRNAYRLEAGEVAA